MSLTYNTKVTLPSNAKQSALVSSASNQVAIAYATPALRVYNLTSGAQVGSTATLANNCDGMVVVANGASAVCATNSSSNWQLVQLSTAYVQTYAGGLAMPFTDHNQQMDYDPVNGIVMGGSSTSGKVSILNLNTYAMSQVTPAYLNYLGAKATCVFFKGNGRFIIGTDQNCILEIDSAGNTYNVIRLPLDQFEKQAPGTGVYHVISHLALWNDILTVISKVGNIYQYSYTNGDLLYKSLWNIGSFSNPVGAFLCTPVSGIVICGGVANPNNAGMYPVFEVDISMVPYQIRDVAWFSTSTSNYYNSVGINPATNAAWAGNFTDSTLYLFTLAAKPYVNTFVKFNDPPGVPVQGSCIMYDETDSTLICDVTVPPAGANISVPTGKTMLQIGMIYNGTDTKFDLTEFST